MQVIPSAPRVSVLRFLIESSGPSGFLLVFLSLGLILWGLVNLAFVKNRGVLGAQAILSLMPGILSCYFLGQLLIYMMTANNQGPLDPTQAAQFASTALVGGIIGTFATVLPTLIGILALVKQIPRKRVLTSGETV